MNKRSLGNAMLSGAALSGVRLVTGVFRIKILAISLGLGGVGIFSLLMQIYSAGSTLVSLSLAVAIINLGRPHVIEGNTEHAGELIGTVSAIAALNSVIMALLWWWLQGGLSQSIAEKGFGEITLWPIAAAIVLTAYSSTVWEGLTFLADRFDLYVKIGIIGALLDGVLIASASYFYGLEGAVRAIPLSALALLLVYILLATQDRTIRRILSATAVRLSTVPKLLGYSATMMATISLTAVGTAYLRSRVLVEAGADSNGELQVATALSAYILPFVMTGFWGHLHPLASGHGDTDPVRHELHHSLFLGTLLSFSGCGFIVIASPFIIPVFYSGQFSNAHSLVTPYMIGELPFQIASMLLAYFLTIGAKRIYIFSSLLYISSLVILGSLLVKNHGPTGYVIAHVLSSLLLLFFCAIVARRQGQIRISFILLCGLCVLTLAAISITLIFSHNQPTIAWLPIAVGLLAVLASGSWALKLLWEQRKK